MGPPGAKHAGRTGDGGGRQAYININCSDLERSIAFYEKLGFEVIHVIAEDTKDLGPGGDRMAGAAGYRGSHCRGVIMSLGDHPRCWTKLELLQDTRPATAPEPPRTAFQVGYCRMAIRCKDIHAEVARSRPKASSSSAGSRPPGPSGRCPTPSRATRTGPSSSSSSCTRASRALR